MYLCIVYYLLTQSFEKIVNTGNVVAGNSTAIYKYGTLIDPPSPDIMRDRAPRCNGCGGIIMNCKKKHLKLFQSDIGRSEIIC